MKALLLLAVGFLLVGSDALAHSVEDTKFVLHVKNVPESPSTVCTTWSPVPPESTWATTPPTPCRDFATMGDLHTDHVVYLVVAETNPDGIAGVSCGITYGGDCLRIGWTRCSDLEFPSGGWPAPGGGNRITWARQTNCQKTVVPPNGVQVVAGWFSVYAYTSDVLRITANMTTPEPELAVADCNAMITTGFHYEAAGWATFSPGAVVPGCNTCRGSCTGGWPSGCRSDVESATWGRIKSKYGTAP